VRMLGQCWKCIGASSSASRLNHWVWRRCIRFSRHSHSEGTWMGRCTGWRHWVNRMVRLSFHKLIQPEAPRWRLLLSKIISSIGLAIRRGWQRRDGSGTFHFCCFPIVIGSCGRHIALSGA